MKKEQWRMLRDVFTLTLVGGMIVGAGCAFTIDAAHLLARQRSWLEPLSDGWSYIIRSGVVGLAVIICGVLLLRGLRTELYMTATPNYLLRWGNNEARTHVNY